MSFDAHTNFAYATVALPPSPGISGTSLVATGAGTIFPGPPYNAVVWPVGQQVKTINAEVVRITGNVGDTLTIVRTQEGSTARSIIAGDQIAVAVTAKTLTDIEGAVSGITLSSLGAATVATTGSYNDLINQPTFTVNGA